MLKIKGIILKQALQSAGIRQEDAAKKLNKSRQTLSNWFSRENLGTDIIEEVKDRLGIDLKEGREQVPTVPLIELLKTKDTIIKQLESRIEEKTKHLEDKEEIIQLLKKKG